MHWSGVQYLDCHTSKVAYPSADVDGSAFDIVSCTCKATPQLYTSGKRESSQETRCRSTTGRNIDDTVTDLLLL